MADLEKLGIEVLGEAKGRDYYWLIVYVEWKIENDKIAVWVLK